MEDQKNLRRQYQDMQSGLQRFIADNVISSDQSLNKDSSESVKLRKQFKKIQRMSANNKNTKVNE